MFRLKESVIAVCLVFGSSAMAEGLPRYQQGGTDYAVVAPSLMVRSSVYLTDPSPESAYFITGVRNRTANPVRIIWYGNPNDGDSLVPQFGAINEGAIVASLRAVGMPSGATLEDNEKDYRSSIAIDGQANALDAYGWSAQSNSNDVEFTLKQILNRGEVRASADLEAGAGSHRGLIASNASANGISLFGSVDYGKYVYLEGVAGEVAVDALVGGSGSVATLASLPTVRLASVDVASSDAEPTLGVPPVSFRDREKDTDFYGKNVMIALERLDNSGHISGEIQAKGNPSSQANQDTMAQDYASVTWASGNGVSLRTSVMTQDKRTYAYEKQNHASLGAVNNTGVLTGSAMLKTVATITHPGTNYTRSIDSGNGMSVASHTVRFAKHRTTAHIGDIDNEGLIAGSLTQVSSDNHFTSSGLTFEGIHYYSQAQSLGSGNGVNLFVEATQQSLGTVSGETGMAADDAVGVSLGRLNNKGVIRGEANLRAGDGHGVLSISAEGVGNGVSTYLKAGAAQTYYARVGDIHNTGMITGSLVTQAGSNDQSVERKSLQMLLTDRQNWNKLKRPSQVPDRPKTASLCETQACHQSTALTEIRGAGNGISMFTNRLNGGSLHLGTIDNRGVVSGYALMKHGYADNQYQRVDYLGAGVGIAIDQAMSSSLLNMGIISGNHAALLAKSEISDAYSVSDPNFLSAYTSGTLKNYGLMAGMMIAGNYDGKRMNTETDKGSYLYFNADQDPIQNQGTYVYFTSRVMAQAPHHTGYSPKYTLEEVNRLRSDFQHPTRSQTLSQHASKIRDILEAQNNTVQNGVHRGKKALFTTYRSLAESHIKKIERAYGGETNGLSADDRIHVFLNIYNMMVDTETADTFTIHHDTRWLSNAQWRVEEDRREILAKKNKLKAQKTALDALLAKRSQADQPLGAGLEKLVGMYTEYYYAQLTALNEKLNTINHILETEFHQPAVAKVENDHLPQPEHDGVASDVNATYGTIERIVSAGSDKVTVQVGDQPYQIINAPIDGSGRDSHYMATEDLLERTIVNGVGVSKGALVANHDLTVRQSIINGLATGLYLEGAHHVRLDQTVVNANGFDLKVMPEAQDGVVEPITLSPVAIRGDGYANELVLANQTIVNGNIDLGSGDDKLVIADQNVILNGRWVDMGEGKDTLVLGERATMPEAGALMTIRTPFKQLERLEVNQNAKIFASAQMSSLDELVLNAKLSYEGDYVMKPGQTLQIGVSDPLHYGSLEVENGHLSIADGRLFIDASSFQGDTVALGKMLSQVISLKSSAIQDTENNIVSEPEFHILGHFSEVQDNSELFDFVPVYRPSEISANVVSLAETRRHRRHAVLDLPKSSGMMLIAKPAASGSSLLLDRVSEPSDKQAATVLEDVLQNQPMSHLSLAMMSLSSPEAVRTTIHQSVPYLRAYLGGAVQNMSMAMSDVVSSHPSTGAWIQTLAQQSRHRDPQAYQAHHYGFVLGRTVRFSDKWLGGLSGAYTHARLQSEDKSNKFDMDLWQLGAYTHWQASAWAIDTQLAYTWGRFYGHRQFEWLPKQVAYSSALTDVAQARFKLSYQLSADRAAMQFTPYVQTRYAMASLDAYQEKGSALSLNVGREIHRSWVTDVGVSSTWQATNKLALQADFALGLEALTRSSLLSVAYQAYPDSPFVLASNPNGRFQAKLALGLNYALSANSELGIQYQVQVKKHYREQQAQFNMRVQF